MLKNKIGSNKKKSTIETQQYNYEQKMNHNKHSTLQYIIDDESNSMTEEMEVNNEMIIANN